MTGPESSDPSPEPEPGAAVEPLFPLPFPLPPPLRLPPLSAGASTEGLLRPAGSDVVTGDGFCVAVALAEGAAPSSRAPSSFWQAVSERAAIRAVAAKPVERMSLVRMVVV